MPTLKGHMFDALEDLDNEQLNTFKWFLQQSENVEGFKPLSKASLQNAERTGIIDLITQSFSGKESQVMVNVLGKVKRNDLAARFKTQPTGE